MLYPLNDARLPTVRHLVRVSGQVQRAVLQLIYTNQFCREWFFLLLQLRHHYPRRGQSFFRSAPTTDHEVIGIVDDVCSKTLFVPQLLPSEHEPAHIEITEQRDDRRTLWVPVTFAPIARTPMLLPTLNRGHVHSSSNLRKSLSMAVFGCPPRDGPR